jgi:hypothetical protein
VSIDFAQRSLKFVQRVIEPAPRFIHGLHLFAKLDPLLHLNVVLFDAILDLATKASDFLAVMCD